MPVPTLATEAAEILDNLADANRAFAARYPGDRPDRQPVHTVYGGAHLFKADTAERLGQLALRSLDTYAPDPATFAAALDIPDHLAATVYDRVVHKLKREAVEDFRIDFEDGFGVRPDPEEDDAALTAAHETARAMESDKLPPFIGIRIKPFTPELTARSVRTLDIYINELAVQADVPPANFVVTLPKVTIPEQVTALADMLSMLENKHNLRHGALKLELMIEVTQAIFDAQGMFNLPRLVAAARDRCVGAHFGTYDYTASNSVTAAYQIMRHPVCDLAKNLMQIAYGSTGLFLSDGATNIMPVGPHRAAAGEALSAEHQADNTRVVHAAWKTAYDDIRHSLANGFYQGWDLHPAQLPVRYAACYAFFLEGFDQAAARLKNFVDKAAQATLVGDVFDDAATGQGLLNYFVRALNSGAISLDEIAATGLTRDELQLRSFGKILEQRRERLRSS